MKRRTIRGVCTGVAVLAVLAGQAAWAAEAASSTNGSVAVVNDYLFRGLSQTNQKPAVQPGIEYDHASGWYVGAWGSNISWLSDTSTSTAPLSSSLEVDLYTGYRGSFSGGWSYDVGLYEYYYPGDYPAGFTRPYTTEGYVSLAYKTLSLKYSHSFTNLFGFPDSRHSGYLDLSWNVEFTPGWTLNTHVGHQHVANTPGFSYTDWKLGVTRAFSHGYSVALGYYDTNAKRTAYTNAYGHFVGRATGVLSLSKAF
ncbi:hypothetical protein B0E47_01675 [Rhodanobacter sp. B05]|uniref:TorF family putative porin n=1 Tax=Rhodanobacter sp. B05 TaxID=1945859 RepID=UPI000984BD99|nr:TorF family putative porin [Rhodanobacter sp. B05]OOG60844.1 hypothetical protein B0E47_01675 [Rhodanobacter sp. B05]